MPKPSCSLLRRLIQGAAALAALGVAGIAVLLVLVWWDHGTEITLPAPTGRFAVGRTACAWVNDSQTGEPAPAAGAKREVYVWIWYPAAASQSVTAAEYLPSPWRTALAQHTGWLMSGFLTRDLSLVRTHSSSDPGVSPDERSYPVVIMRAGGGALTTAFTTLAEDLASHGYVVAGFDAPYRSMVFVFPDGRVAARPPGADPESLAPADQGRLVDKLLAMWSGDTKFVVDQLDRLNAADPSGRFTGRLDMRRLGMFGHSLGGATALQFCHDDSRCQAGIDIDGAPYGSVVRDSLAQPFLFLLSDHGDLSGSEARAVFGDIKSIYNRLPNGRLLLVVRGTNHFSFSDEILLKSRPVVRLLLLLQRGIDSRRGLAITAACVHTFFDVHLKNAPANLLKDLRSTYPEVQNLAP